MRESIGNTEVDVPRLITLGETMAMVTPVQAESLLTARDFRLHAGGAESNVASHMARMGVTSAWVSALGDDVLGRRVCQAIADRDVDTRWVSFDPTAPTGVYFKDPGHRVYYYRRGSAASRMTAATVSDVPFESADIVHLTGITPALSNSCAGLLDTILVRIASSKARVSFDVNYRASLWDHGGAADTLRLLARRADIVFVGQDEAEALWGCRDAEAVRSLLPEPGHLIVKDAAVGATEFALEKQTFVPAIPTDVVEAVGAGDAFAAGYLAACLRGKDSRARLDAGHQCARQVLLSTSDFIAEPIEEGK